MIPLVKHHASRADRNTRVVTASNSEFVDVPAGAIADLARAFVGEYPAQAAPTETPADTAVIYLDEADGDLKVRFPNGTVATLATN